jgi:flagellar motility protein MotE (MotC chaperone)
MRFILTAMVTVLVAHSLAIVGLLSYGMATGRLGPEARQQYLATWRGDKLAPPVPPVGETAPEESPQEASSRIAAAKSQQEIASRELQRQMEQLRAMKATIEMAQAKLDKDLRSLQQAQEAFAAQTAAQRQAAQDEGFQKVLARYSDMKPKYVVADFMKMDDEEVARYVAAMKTDTATTILNNFRSPPEQEKRQRVMKLLEVQKVIALNDAAAEPGHPTP